MNIEDELKEIWNSTNTLNKSFFKLLDILSTHQNYPFKETGLSGCVGKNWTGDETESVVCQIKSILQVTNDYINQLTKAYEKEKSKWY